MAQEENIVESERLVKDSIELSKDAKDVYRWSIKVYFEDGHEEEAVARLSAIDRDLRSKFTFAG
jgi:hypothetical protein